MADPQEQVYNDFLNYDWDSSEDFKNGIAEILEGHLELLKEQDPHVTQIPPADQQQLIDQAKLFFFCSQTGHILNLDDFYQWKSLGGGKIVLLADDHTADNTVDQKDEGSQVDGPHAELTGPEETPYSSNYQQLVELIVSGKPVPGIKQIPDTVLQGQESKLEAKTRAKPWEKAGEPESSEKAGEQESSEKAGEPENSDNAGEPENLH